MKLGVMDAPAVLMLLCGLVAGTLSGTSGCGSSSPRRAGSGGAGGGAVGGAASGGNANGGVDGEGGGASFGGRGSEGGAFGQTAGAGGVSAEGGAGAAGGAGGMGGIGWGGECDDTIICLVGNTRCVVNDLQTCLLDPLGCPTWISTRAQPSQPFPDCPLKHFICGAVGPIGCDCPTDAGTDSGTDTCGAGSN